MEPIGRPRSSNATAPAGTSHTLSTYSAYEHDERARFTARVAECLTAQGQWLSLIGSTEGPARDHGPPRRSVRDIANAIEPVLQIALLRTIEFDAELPSRAAAWLCLARQREVPAQPSTV